MSDDQTQLLLLINQAISPNFAVSQQALQLLYRAFERIEAFNHLFQVIDTCQDGQQRLVAVIYLQNWVKVHYKCLENQQIQDLLRLRCLFAYNQEPTPQAKSMITLAIVTMGTLDFPLNTFLLENVPRDSDVSYQLLKNIVKLKFCIYREKLEFIFKNINVRLNDFYEDLRKSNPQNLQHALKALIIPLKLRVLESRVLTEHQTSILDYLKQLEFINLLKKQVRDHSVTETILQIIYYYHKCVLRAMSRQEKVDTSECSYVLLYLKTFYFDDHSMAANNSMRITSQKDLDKILQSSDEERNFQEKILRITLQVVRLVNTVLDLYSYQPAYDMSDFEQQDLEALKVQGKQILEISFYEGYFETSINYLFNYAMQLSLIQLYNIYYEPEKSFTEEVEESVAYDIRETSIEFLRTAFIDMKSEYITHLLLRQIQSFKDQPLVAVVMMVPSSEVPFMSPPADPGQIWACVLQREAFYCTIARLFRIIRHDIDFEGWFISHLSDELNDTSPLLLPLKLQILYMMNQYFDCQPEVSLDFYNIIANSCLRLLKTSDIISIKLGCLRCLAQIVEQMSEDLRNQLFLQREHIQNIFMQCQQGSSKILLLEFFVQMLQINAFDAVWVIKVILNEWETCKLNNNNNNVQNTLSLQGKILQVLCRALRVTPWNVWFPTLETLVTLIVDALGSDAGLNEIFLVENGLSLFLHLFCRLSLKPNQEAINLFKGQGAYNQILQCALDRITTYIGQIMTNNIGLWNHCILGLGYLLVLGLGNDALIIDILIQTTVAMYDEIKEEAFSRLLFITELFILTDSSQVVHCETIITFLVDRVKIYHPIFNEHSVEQRELISITHLISVLAYTKNPLFWKIVQTQWFTALLQKTFYAHKMQIPLQQHKLCMFYLMCSQLIRNDSYVMSQLNVSRHSGIPLNDITLECFDFLQQYFIKRLDFVPSPIYVAFREIISQQEDELSVRGLQSPNVQGMQGYIITYPKIKEDFLSIKSLFQGNETLSRIESNSLM